MMKSTMPYVIRPLFLACSCLALPAGFAFGVYMLFFHQWDSLPGIIKGIAVVLLPIPFVLMQILLAKAFYYFELFGKRLAIGYGENRAILEHLIAAGEPFCLYLRNHSFENGSVIHTFQVRADREPLSRTGLVHWPVTNNAFESSVVAGIEAHLPVFAIDSPSDSSVGTARRIVVQDNHWSLVRILAADHRRCSPQDNQRKGLQAAKAHPLQRPLLRHRHPLRVGQRD